VSDTLIVALLMAINGLLAMEMLGVQYRHFSWAAEAWAQTYYPTPTATPSQTATATVTRTGTPTRTPSLREDSAGAAACADGIDNDNNGLTDCSDPACQAAPPCLHAAPTLSWGGIVAGLLLLALTGVSALARRPNAD
jgi:hypothetical protein